MKPTKATLQKRLEEILEIRLCGATFFDARRYVAEKEAASEEPWTVPEGGKPVSERTLWRYIQMTDKMIAETCREGRKRLLRRHLAQRRNLFAKCVNMGDMRAALACLQDEARLVNLYDDEVTRQIEELKKQLAEIKAHANGNAQKTIGGDGQGSSDAETPRAADPRPAAEQPRPLHGEHGTEAGPLAKRTVDDLLADDQPPLFG
jgi:hypothetical protein